MPSVDTTCSKQQASTSRGEENIDTMAAVPDSASADTPDLICVVCGDKANGMHYRALTCEGCKTFFRRNARNRDTLKCEMMGAECCEMDLYTRRHCAACRMKKCLSVGMQPDRLWDKDRLATRKPIKKKVKVKPEAKETSPKEGTAVQADVSPDVLAKHLDIAELIRVAYATAKDNLPPRAANEDTPKSNPAVPDKEAHSSPSGSQATSPTKAPFTQSTPSAPAPAPTTDLSPVSSSLPGAQQPGRIPDNQTPSNVGVVKRCECGCIIHNKPAQPVVAGSEAETKTAADEVRIDQGAAKTAVSAPSGEDREPLAGGMMGPGLFPEIMDLVILLLRHMINFAKRLPGFQTLTADDQATLIKGALVEYLILTSCPLYNMEEGAFNSEIWPTLTIKPDQVESVGFTRVMTSAISFAEKMKRLELHEEELALLFSLAIMSPDRKDLNETTKVDELQQPLVDTLQTCVQQNHPNKMGHFAKIIMLLTEVRNATEDYMDDLLSMQFNGNKLNPLLEELFSD